MIARHDRLDALAMGSMLLFSALWGLNQVVTKVSNAGISPLLQAGLRSAGAALLLLAWTWARGGRLFKSDGTLGAGLLAGLLFAAEFGLIYWALQYTNASRGVIFIYTAPFVVAAGMHWFLRSERLGQVQAAGMVCAFAGVAAAFGESLTLPTGRQALGDGMMLVAAILWGATTVTVRATRLATASASKTLFYQLAVSGVLLPLASLAWGEPGFTDTTPLIWSLLGFQIVVVAFASYLGWFWLIARYPATRLAAFSFLTPLFGMMFGAAILHERITPILALAMILVGAGIWMVNRPKQA